MSATRWVGAVVAIQLALLAHAPRAAEEPARVPRIPRSFIAALDSELEQVHERPYLGKGPLWFERYHLWKRRLSDRHRLDYAIRFSPMVQAGSRDGRVHGNAVLDFSGQWQKGGDPRFPGEIRWMAVYRQTLGTLRTLRFADRQKLLIPPNDADTGGNDHDVALEVLWWEQAFADGGWDFGYRIGQADAQTQWTVNELIDDDRESFLSLPLSGARDQERSIGLALQAAIWNGPVYFSAGFQDAKGDEHYPDFDSFFDGKYAYYAELGLETWAEGHKKTDFAVTGVFTDRTGSGASERAGWTFGATFSHRFDSGLGVFARFIRLWRRLPDRYRGSFVAGFVWRGLIGTPSDEIGVSYVFGEATRDKNHNAHGFEIFWRLQLTQRLTLTPDLQVFPRPGIGSSSTPSVVGGARLRWAF